MLNVQKKQIKTIDDYRHNIKLLKYHLKKESKANEKLKYEAAKAKHKRPEAAHAPHQIYSLSDSVKTVSTRLKRMGLVLGDLFRMADETYQGEITKEQFTKLCHRLRTDLEDSLFTEMFYAIDTSLNGLISEEQFAEFSIAYGGCTDSKQIRRFENKVKAKLAVLIQQKKGSNQSFISKLEDPVPASKFSNQIKALGLSDNQAMLMLKIFDPSHEGNVRHKVFLSLMEKVKPKTEKQQKQQEYEKGIQELCAQWRDMKLNPIDIFQEADVDGKQGVSVFELEQAFKKLMPGQTNYQVKKWVAMINLNNDSEITKEEYLNSIRSFYSLAQMSKFSTDYEKKHPELARKDGDEESSEAIMKELAFKIEDSGMSRQDTFNFIDFNKNGQISKEEMLEGLKRLGMNINFIGRVMSVFDRDSSGEVDLKEWQRILGRDVKMEDVPIPDFGDDFESEEEAGDKAALEKKKKAAALAKEKAQSKDVKMKENQGKQQNKTMKKSNSVIKKQTANKTQKEQKEQPLIKKTDSLIEKKFAEDQMNKTIDRKAEAKSKAEEKSALEKKESQKSALEKKESQVKPKPVVKPDTTNKPDKKPDPKQDVKPDKKPDTKPITKPDVKPDVKPDTKPGTKPKAKQQVKPPVKQDSPSEAEVEETAEIDVEPAEISLAEQYKKNKKNMMAIFQKKDPKKKGKVNMQDFKWCLKQADGSLAPQVTQQIYMKNCSSDGLIQYEGWLEQIGENYAAEIQQEQQPPSEKEEQQQEQQSNKVEEEQEEYEQDDQGMEESRAKDQSENQERQDEKEKKQVGKQTSNLEKDSVKRGDNMKAFLNLVTLSITSADNIDERKKQLQKKQPEKKSTQSGYKLLKYIDEQGKMKEICSKMLGKAQLAKKAGRKFQDFDFQPKETSLISPGAQSQIPNIKLLKWKHYSEIYKDPKLFSGAIQPNDIRQGTLGDCYFLSALACLAEYRNMIERLFEYHDMETGYFLIWMCIDGMWRLVELDGYIPVSADGRTPAFSRSTEQQLWVLLLEKAYAKCYGNYNNIVGGQPFQAIKDLSGAPGENYAHDKMKMDEIWELLMAANSKQHMMTAATKMDGGQDKQQGHTEGITAEGVVLGHAYSILDLQKVKRTGERLIQLRNPWGQMEWKGDWSDQSKKWETEIEFKKSVKYQCKGDDGIFWMPLEAYYQNFVCTAINFINPQYYYQSSLQKNVQQFGLRIKLSEFTNGFFMVSQTDHRHEGLPPNTPYVLCNIMAFILENGKCVKKVSNKSQKYVREVVAPFEGLSEFSPEAEAVVLVKLEKGTDVVIGFYCDKADADFEITTKDCLDLMDKVAISQDTNKQTINQTTDIWITEVQGVAFLCFRNISNSTVSWNVEVPDPMNIKIIPPTMVKNKFKIEPGQTYCLRGRVLDLSKGFNFNQKITN